MRFGKAVQYTVVGLMGVAWLAPVYLIIVNASKSSTSYGASSPWRIAGEFDLWGNLVEAWTRGGFSQSIASTTLYAIVAPLVAVLIGAGAGYAIVALKLRHAFFWFVVIFGGTVVPLQMLLMPLFIEYADLGLYDTRLGLILIYAVICIPFSAFVLRNFMQGISSSVFEAAVMDGAGTLRIFARIYLPMSFSALVAVFILEATLIWNDLLLGLTLSQSPDVRPIVTTLSAMQSTYGGSTLPIVLAGGLIVSLPTIALFVLTQRAFTRGLALGQY